MRITLQTIPALLAVIPVCAQTAPARLEFEVASIKPSAPPGTMQVKIGLHIDGAQVHCNFLSLKDYIRMAYRVKDYQIVGPEWMASQRFDIAAKLPEGSNRDQVPDMLKALLADRFLMKMHRDSKEFRVYGLVVTKGGLKIKESAADGDSVTPGDPNHAPVNVQVNGGPAGTTVNMGKGSSFSFGNNRLEVKKLTMAVFAELLARFVDRPVVDMTQLKGNYDIAMEMTAEDFRAMMIRAALANGIVLPPEAMKALEASSGDSLMAALQNIGLKLEQRKAPLEVLIIDEIQKAPTEN